MKAKIRQLIHCGKLIKWKYLAIAVLILCGMIVSSPALPAYAGGCDDVRFIFARGSGESLHDKSYNAWQSEITQQLKASTLHYGFYELGSTNQLGYQYPAVAVGGDFWGYVNLVGAAFSGGNAFAFGESVRQGMNELKSYISNVSVACPNTKFVLGGYSQGAMVLSQSLSDIPADKIVYVTTFGDPKLYLPEGNNRDGLWRKVPDACRGKNLSNYRTYVPDCHAYEGVLGSQRPYQTQAYFDKIGTWCNASDIMCSSGMNIDDHSAYISEDLYGDASRKIYQKLYDNFHYAFPNGRNPSLHDVVFMLDGTGSMKDVMPEYRPELKNLAKQVFESGGRVAAYVYRDSIDSDTTTKLCDFSCTKELFDRRLGLYISMDGGDREESLLAGLYHAMDDLDWQWGATKSIVVVTDDWYRKLDYNNITLQTVVEKSLSIDPVNVYVVGPKAIQDYYSDLVTQTNGAFFDIAKDVARSTSQILSRPVAKLNLANYYGAVGEEITFDASESFSQDGKTLTFDWDLDGDGKFEYSSPNSTITTTYAQALDGYIQVRVKDGSYSSTMSAKVQIVERRPMEKLTSITDLAVTPQANNSVATTFTTDGEYVLLSLNDAVLGFVKVTNGAGEFTVNNAASISALTLTPYSVDKVRGISRSVEVSTESPTPPADTKPPVPSETLPTQPETPAKPTPTPSLAPALTLTPTIRPDISQSLVTSSPSAPDTSAYDPSLQANNRREVWELIQGVLTYLRDVSLSASDHHTRTYRH